MLRQAPLACGILLLSCLPLAGQTKKSATDQTSFRAFSHDQAEAERRAIRLVNRTDFQAELTRLEATWKQRWPSLLPATLKQAHASLQELALLVALETVNGDPRRPHLIQFSMPPHTWFGIHVPGGRWGVDNPDTQYFVVPLESASSYVLTGKRATHGPADANFSFGSIDRWNTIENIGLIQLHLAEDGSYTITLDAMPAQGRSNHIQLRPQGDCLIIRNTLADWGRDTIDRMAIKRISGPEPVPAPKDDALEAAMVTRVRGMLQRVIDTLQAPVLALPVNTLPQPGKPGDKAGFLATQRNALGHFRLAPDEAMVVTLQPGAAAYTTVPVTNVWGVSPDYGRYQTSLNNRQAVPNSDGSYTVVVSRSDPSVANWVDTAGLEEGILMLRWQVLPQSATTEPAVQSTVVKLADLADVLPPTTVYYNQAQRKEQIALRRAGFARRFKDR